MSDSGFGQISSPAQTAAQKGSGRSGLVVQILVLPKTIDTSAKALRLEGQITSLKSDGSARISTPEGDIDVKIRGNKRPQIGQRIEIDLPAGRQPRQAVIREISSQNISRGDNNSPVIKSTAPPPPQTVITDPRIVSPIPEKTAPQAQQNINTQITTNNTQTPIKQPVTGQQPLPPLLQENPAQNITPQTQARPLTTETAVRLIGVPPAQAQTVATEFVQNLTLQQVIIPRVQFTANLIAENAQNNLSRILIQTTPVKPAPLAAQVLNILQPVLNKGFFQNLAPIQTTPVQTTATLNIAPEISLLPTAKAPTPATPILPTITNTQAIPTAQTVPPATANILLQSLTQPAENTAAKTQPVNITGTPSAQITTPITTPQTASLTSLPITFDPTNPATFITPRIDKIDIQVVKITPPEILLVPPTTEGTRPAPPLPAATQFTPPLTSTNNAATVTAQVTGFTGQSLPLVTVQWPGTPLPQSFVLQFKSNNLQLGTQLQIIPKASTAPLPTLTALLPQTTNPLLRGFQWPALDELYSDLSRISPQAAASLSRALPNPANAAQIGPAAMMFIAAVRSGDIGTWLGDKKIDLIQRAGRSNILGRLVQDSAQTARTVEPASSGDWRAVPLPMFWEGEIHKITLYTRHENQNNQQDQNGNGQTRFVFDLSLSRMGDVQLDGLLRDKRLDLVVRTENAFSSPMQQAMRQAYTSALDSTDLTGDLNFQGSTKNWVHVLEKNEQLGVEV